jgi:hypothetical protein
MILQSFRGRWRRWRFSDDYGVVAIVMKIVVIIVLVLSVFNLVVVVVLTQLPVSSRRWREQLVGSPPQQQLEHFPSPLFHLVFLRTVSENVPAGAGPLPQQELNQISVPDPDRGECGDLSPQIHAADRPRVYGEQESGGL